MAINLSRYYGGGGSGRKPTGNRRLSEYYGDKGQGYTSASQVASAFAANIDQYPRYFKRNFIAEKLRMSHDRELALLSDALSVLETRGLIKFDKGANQWKNLQGDV